MQLDDLDFSKYNYVDGDFENLDIFVFKGVYIIWDPSNSEIVYIGSAYARDIKIRLKQYLIPKNTGNTLAKTIARKNNKNCSVSKLSNSMLNIAIKQIKKYSVRAIKHQDLEYQFIEQAKPIFNKCGKKED